MTFERYLKEREFKLNVNKSKVMLFVRGKESSKEGGAETKSKRSKSHNISSYANGFKEVIQRKYRLKR